MLTGNVPPIDEEDVLVAPLNMDVIVVDDDGDGGGGMQFSQVSGMTLSPARIGNTTSAGASAAAGATETAGNGDREKQPLAGDSRPTLWVLGGKGGTRQIRTIPMCIY